MMNLRMSFDGEDLFVQGEWADVDGHHSMRITEDLPPEVATAARAVCDWANTAEAGYSRSHLKYRDTRELEREIAKLETRLATARGVNGGNSR
jgi:hypothetical protein